MATWSSGRSKGWFLNCWRPGSAINCAHPKSNRRLNSPPAYHLRQLPLCHRFDVHLIRPICQSQSPHHRPRSSQKSILRNSRPSVRLYRAIQHAQRHIRRHDFDHRNLRTCRLISHRIHHISRFQCQQSRLLDLHPRFCNSRANRSLLRQRFSKRHPRLTRLHIASSALSATPIQRMQ